MYKCDYESIHRAMSTHFHDWYDEEIAAGFDEGEAFDDGVKRVAGFVRHLDVIMADAPEGWEDRYAQLYAWFACMGICYDNPDKDIPALCKHNIAYASAISVVLKEIHGW